MKNMTQRDALITKNYIFGDQKINSSDRNFFVRKCEKEFLVNSKIELAKKKNITQPDALNTKNYILGHQKGNF